MTERKVNVKQQSQVIQDRDATLAAEANEWARGQVRKHFETHKTGYFLVSDVMQALDEDVDAPSAWLRWLSDYTTRYHMVRNAVVGLHKAGMLDTREEKNALGRDALAYARASDLDDWDIQVTADGAVSESVTDMVLGWLRSNNRTLKPVRTIAITRKSKQSHEGSGDLQHRAGASRPGPAVRRRRS